MGKISNVEIGKVSRLWEREVVVSGRGGVLAKMGHPEQDSRPRGKVEGRWVFWMGQEGGVRNVEVIRE